MMNVYFDRIRHGEGGRREVLYACLYDAETNDLAISADMPYCLEVIKNYGWVVVHPSDSHKPLLRAIVTLCENAKPGNERIVLDNIRDVAEAAMKGRSA
jgi:hypothetical protein